MQINANTKQNNRYDITWRRKKLACEQNECKQFHIDEGMNCVNKCISEKCYGDIYEENPLEDGEIDIQRSRKFQECLRKEAKVQQVELYSSSLNIN